jgi:hypothetical protein
VIGVAAGENVEIYVVAEDGGSDNGIVFVAGGKLGVRIERFCVDHCTVFNPADLVFLGLDFEEPVAAFEDYEPLAIHHFGYAIGDGGDAVVQVHLARGDVHGIVLFLVKARTSGEEYSKAQ